MAESEMFGTDAGVIVGRARGRSSLKTLRHISWREGPTWREAG